MGDILIKILVCFIAGAGAGIGTGFAGMSAAAVIGPMLITFLGVPAYDAVGIGLISDVLASLVSAYTYKKSGNLDVKNSLPLLWRSTRKRIFFVRPISPIREEMKMTQNMPGIWRSWPTFFGSTQMKK